MAVSKGRTEVEGSLPAGDKIGSPIWAFKRHLPPFPADLSNLPDSYTLFSLMVSTWQHGPYAWCFWWKWSCLNSLSFNFLILGLALGVSTTCESKWQPLLLNASLEHSLFLPGAWSPCLGSPWRYLGKKCEVKWSEVAQLCPTLCDPMDCSLPGSIHGIFQARILEWVAISFSTVSSWPRDRTQVSHIAGRCFTVWATREVNPYCWLFMQATPPGTSYLLGWWQKLWFSLFNIEVFPFSFISLGIWIFLIW